MMKARVADGLPEARPSRPTRRRCARQVMRKGLQPSLSRSWPRPKIDRPADIAASPVDHSGEPSGLNATRSDRGAGTR